MFTMTRLRSHTLPLLMLFCLMVYMAFGFSIIILPSLEPFTFGIFTFGAIFAGVQHLRGNWRFYHTPLTLMVAIWALAIGISYVANPHVWRISLEAIWYVGLFIGVMAFFTGALTNHAFTRETVEEAFLLLGAVMVAIGYAQIATFISQGRNLPLLASLIGSPNYYAMLLIIIAMLALHRAIASHMLVVKLGMGLYVLAVLVQLWLTGSRGGQIGFVAAICSYILVWLMTSPTPDALPPYMRIDAVARQRTGIRLIWIGVVGAVLVMAIIVAIILSGNLSNRSEVYSVAIDLFVQKPITGQGLFSYGEQSMPFLATPQNIISAHAHSAVLNVLAELGLLGLVALGYSILTGIRAIIANRRALTTPNRRGYDAIVAVLVGLSVHQLFDLALLYVSLLIFIVIVLVVTPVAPQPVTRPVTRRGLTIALGMLFMGLLLGAMWHLPQIVPYSALLKDLRQQRVTGVVDYPDLMKQLQDLITLDPENRTYRLQIAVLAGEYAYQTNATTDIEVAIQAHTEALMLMPHLAVGWSNLASLHWQAGDIEAARDAASTAVRYADHWLLPRWQYWAYRKRQYLPWVIHDRKYNFSGSLIYVYMRDIAEPIVLAQTSDSISMSPDEVWWALVRRLFAIEISNETMSNPTH